LETKFKANITKVWPYGHMHSASLSPPDVSKNYSKCLEVHLTYFSNNEVRIQHSNFVCI